MKCHTHVQKVANNILNANGILHKFKYVFSHIIKYIYIYFFNRITHKLLYTFMGHNYEIIFKLQKQAIHTISLSHFKTHTSVCPL